MYREPDQPGDEYIILTSWYLWRTSSRRTFSVRRILLQLCFLLNIAAQELHPPAFILLLHRLHPPSKDEQRDEHRAQQDALRSFRARFDVTPRYRNFPRYDEQNDG